MKSGINSPIDGDLGDGLLYIHIYIYRYIYIDIDRYNPIPSVTKLTGSTKPWFWNGFGCRDFVPHSIGIMQWWCLVGGWDYWMRV